MSEVISSAINLETAAPTSPRRKPGPKPRPVWRIHVTVPGILWESIQTRWAEFAYKAFTPFAIELVCFDLRIRRMHDVTQPISTDPRPLQDAIDRQIIARYRPYQERDFGLMLQLLSNREQFTPDPVAALLPEVSSVPQHVKFPACLQPIIEERWRELGYTGVAPYLTGLIRYDLMLGGPHKYFTGKDKDPALLRELDQLTIAAFRANRRPRILLDRLIEQAVGRTLTEEELRAEMAKLVQRLRASVASAKRIAAAELGV